MVDLKTVVESGAHELAKNHAQLTAALLADTLVPPDCYRLWQQRAVLHTPLRATLDCCPCVIWHLRLFLQSRKMTISLTHRTH